MLQPARMSDSSTLTDAYPKNRRRGLIIRKEKILGNPDSLLLKRVVKCFRDFTEPQRSQA